MVTIKTDIDLPCSLDALIIQDHDKEQLIRLVQELEFKTWLKELLSNEDHLATSALSPPTIAYELITTQEQLAHWLTQLNNAKSFVLIPKRQTLMSCMLNW